MSSLNVMVLSATNLPNVEHFGKSDPYTLIEFQGIKKKTRTIESELNPVWNEDLVFDLGNAALQASDALNILVKDYEKIGNDRLLGQADVALKDLTKGKNEMELNVNLTDANKRPNAATINLRIRYKPPKGGGGGGMGSTAYDTTAGGDTGDDLEDEVDAGEEFDDEQGQTDAQGKKRRKVNKGVRRKLRGKYSNKPQDFQIRVKVIEARQLQGANISPIARVTCINQIKQTRVVKSTNSPYWGEVFFFNINMAPSELFDQLISFGVYNSRRLRSDALIGSFKFDIGMVYEEPQHCAMNKWLLLSDPEDVMAGAKGYLKISAVVLGHGDEAPSFKSQEEDDDDIEANLLRPAGVQLRPATFVLRLYQAEDLPKMDSAAFTGIKKVFMNTEEKDFVDPYILFQFAGKEVKSSIKYGKDCPEYNEEMKIGLQFPSMCERIKIQVYDWDRMTEDDAIGTYVINLSQISAQGENESGGFLPTLGPTFVNLYGSPREFSDLPDEFEALNLGKGEGVAYRGRVLLELNTILGEMPEEALTEIPSDLVHRVQKFMRRRKYRLHAAFMSACMVSEVDAPVEFEVSIGNYGNKLDENVPPSSSTTQPTNAVFDGMYYHFLPWSNNKPCTVVESHWEDISFRLQAINFLLRIADNLENNIEKIKLAVQALLPEEEQAQYVISAFDELIMHCSKDLPTWEPGQSPENELDLNMRAMRENELTQIRKDAMRIREEATSIEQALGELDNFLAQIKALAVEPQNSMPDVVIWMISGEKRKAYYRIPAYEVFYCDNIDFRGRYCGTVQTINLKKIWIPSQKDDDDVIWQIPAQIRIKIWLGQDKEEASWHEMQGEGSLSVLAETYENQVKSIIGSKWVTSGPLMNRPAWSDSSGHIELKKENITCPEGWKWDGDWFESPELSLFFDKDAGHSRYLEDVYINEVRTPGCAWGPAQVHYTDVKGDPCPGPEQTKLPEGWEWSDDWQTDYNRPCDEDGWEYTVEASMGGYVPVEKMYHMCRRKRLIRPRALVDASQLDSQEESAKSASAGECWEYAAMFHLKFHAKERKVDMVRRRRWHRKMKATKPGAPCFFNMGAKDDDEKAKLAAPRMFLTFKKPRRWQLRCYVFQARNLLAGDQTGLSDPYIRIAFLNQSQTTQRIDKTLCPTWDETLLFNNIEIYSDPHNIASDIPMVVGEIFDYDQLGEDEFLGRTQVAPIVKLYPDDPRRPVLQWHPINKGPRDAGQLLAAFELILIDGIEAPYPPPRRGNVFSVPDGIRPVMQRTGIEILCWGVRNMRKFQLSNVNSPSIEFEIGGHVVNSDVIKNTSRNPNFPNPLLFVDVMLPREELYMPPMNIRVRDHRQFGRKPMVGLYCLTAMDQYRRPALSEEHNPILDFPVLIERNGLATSGSVGKGDAVIEMPPEQQTDQSLAVTTKKKIDLAQLDEDIDWWSKYYASMGDWSKCQKYKDMEYDVLQIHKSELEKAGEFTGFTDFCNTFTLVRGKNLDEDEDNVVGEFKGTFRVYPLPEDTNETLPVKYLEKCIPPSDPVECIVRVYIIKAVDLQPNDPSGLADPYIEVKLGRKKESSKENYIPNTLNPIFGKMFELKCTIPIQKDLEIRVYDYDLLSTDDVIGETFIDLENRFLTKYRATCGLPQTYCVTGPNEWRDAQKPKEILESFCEKNRLPMPEYDGNAVIRIGRRSFNLSDFEKGRKPNPHFGPAEERLALYVLNYLPLVKEHVETRPLHTELQPGIEQGKLQMWVDIHPLMYGTPGPPFDISPRKPKQFQLRIIIWNTKDVILEEESITGEKMSDIYVKGWISGVDERQETDVHYRSLDGEGNFNWRFVFPFDYLPAENVMVVSRKEHFYSLDTTEQHLPCNLVIQIWDNDTFSADDFLGTLELNLAHMPAPVKKSRLCALEQLPIFGKDCKMINLFECRRAYGYWPCYNDESGEPELTGKVEMELELLSAEEAELKPAGLGRDEPNENPHLDPPKRPDTSFFWFTSPWKTFKFIIWKKFKYLFLGALAIIVIGLLIVLFIYSVPGLLARKMVKV